MTLAQELEALLPPESRKRFGDLSLSRNSDGVFSARHGMDADSEGELTELDSVSALREMAKYEETGEFRPLKTAPNLKCGWFTQTQDAEEFLKRLDAVYPGVFATWAAYDRSELDPVPLRETLDRQTGMYRFAGSITDQMANQIMRDLCSPGCLRTIAWPIDRSCPVSRLKSSARSIPVICTEACTFAVTEARRLAREAYDAKNAPAT